MSESLGDVFSGRQSPEMQIDERAVSRAIGLIFPNAGSDPKLVKEVTDGIRTIFDLHKDEGVKISTIRPEQLRWYLGANLEPLSRKFLGDDERFDLSNPYHVLAYAEYLSEEAAFSEPNVFDLDEFREL